MKRILNFSIAAFFIILLVIALPQRTYASGYNADDAAAYAVRYYINYNPVYSDFSPADCTNFASQCLYAGGLPTDSTWHNGTVAWNGATSLCNYLYNQGYTYYDDCGKDKMSKGDVIIYRDNDGCWHGSTWFPAEKDWDHSAIINYADGNDVHICSHTWDRCDKDVFSIDYPHYRVYKMNGYTRGMTLTGAQEYASMTQGSNGYSLSGIVESGCKLNYVSVEIKASNGTVLYSNNVDPGTKKFDLSTWQSGFSCSDLSPGPYFVTVYAKDDSCDAKTLADGTPIIIYNDLLNDGIYAYISNIPSGVYLENNDGNVQVRSGDNDNYDPKQIWLFSKQSDGSFVIYNCYDDTVIDNAHSGKNNGNNILSWTANFGSNQKWFTCDTANGSISLINKVSGKALDITGAVFDPGTNVELFTVNESAAQTFNILRLSSQGVDYSKPTKPLATDAKVTDQASVTKETEISWNPVQTVGNFDARTYDISIWKPDGTLAVNEKGLTDTSFKTTFSDFGTYTAQVRVNNSKYKDWYTDSSIISFNVMNADEYNSYVKEKSDALKEMLNAQITLSAETKGIGSIGLSWSTTVSAGTSIWRSTDGINYELITAIESSDTYSYIDTDLNPGTRYYYKVTNYTDFAGEHVYGSSSEPASAVTNDLEQVKASVDEVSAVDVSLSWNSVDCSGYAVDRSDDGINFTELKEISDPKTVAFGDTDLQPGKIYYYKITPYINIKDKKGYGANPYIVTVMTSDVKSTEIFGSKLDSGAVTVSWLSTKCTGYTIYVSNDNLTFTEVKTVDNSILSWTSDSLGSDTEYFMVKPYIMGDDNIKHEGKASNSLAFPLE